MRNCMLQMRHQVRTDRSSYRNADINCADHDGAALAYFYILVLLLTIEVDL